MADNILNGTRKKGSRTLIAIYANCKKFRENFPVEWYKWKKVKGIWVLELEKDLLNNIEFLSPLCNDFNEYQINRENFVEKYSGFPNPDKYNYDDGTLFWSQGSAQNWDGIAIEGEKELYLFEAKAHASEINFQSNESFNKKDSNKEILKTIKRYLKIFSNDFDELAEEKGIFYQIINRLCFLYRLKELKGKKCCKDNKKFERNIKLLFLNFCNDKTFNPEDKFIIVQGYIGAFNSLKFTKDNEYKYKDVYVGFMDLSKIEKSNNQYTKNDTLNAYIDYLLDKKCDNCSEKSICEMYKYLKKNKRK